MNTTEVPAVAGPVERVVGPLAQMRAWRIYVPNWGTEPQAVSIATSRSKAHARSHATANGVGHKLKWGDFRVVRAPEFDSLIEKHGTFAWAWEHAQKMAERPNMNLTGARAEAVRSPGRSGVRLKLWLGLVPVRVPSLRTKET